MPNHTKGYVYFIHAPRLDLIKIGYTSDHPRRRLAALDGASPVELVLLGWCRGSMELEKWIHAELADFRERREWFQYRGILKRFVDKWGSAESEEWFPYGPRFDEQAHQRERLLNRRVSAERMEAYGRRLALDGA